MLFWHCCWCGRGFSMGAGTWGLGRQPLILEKNQVRPCPPLEIPTVLWKLSGNSLSIKVWRRAVCTVLQCCLLITLQIQPVTKLTPTWHNSTGSSCSVGRPTARAPGGRSSRPSAASVTDDYGRQTPTDASEQSNTGPLGGPVKYLLRSVWTCEWHVYSIFLVSWC